MWRDDRSESDSSEAVSDCIQTTKRPYGLCLVGVDDATRQLISKMFPNLDTFAFSSSAFSPYEIDITSAQFLDELHKFYTERKYHMKRLVVMSCGLGEILVQKALVIANQSRRHQELAIIVSNLVFVGTSPELHGQRFTTCRTVIQNIIPATIAIPEPWLTELVVHVDLIITEFLSISRKYDIKNLVQSGDVSIDCQPDPRIPSNSNETTVELASDPSTDNHMNDLMSLYNCLAPLHYLDNDAAFDVSQYLDCLGLLSWSWRPISDSRLPSCLTSANTITKETLLSALKLQEHNSGEYPMSTCLFGPPGCGKTSFLRNFPLSLEHHRHLIVVTFERAEFQAANPSIIEILKSFAHQILSKNPSIFSYIRYYYQFLRHQHVLTEQLLWSLVFNILQDIRDYKIVLLIDDINDWDSPFNKLFAFLKDLRQSKPFELYVIYTATVNVPILASGPGLSINMAEETTQRELTEILKRANSSLLVDKSIEKAIDRELQSISDNCLTSHLYLKKVSRLTTVTPFPILRKLLPQLPYRRDTIYQAEIEMLAEKGRDLLQWCWSSLSWLVRAVHPLTMQELSVAVALHQMESDISIEEIRNHLSIKMWDDLDQHLGLFVRKDRLRPVIVHDTASEFIRSYSDMNTKGEWGLANHKDITMLCLNYLKAVGAKYGDATTEEYPEYGFVGYSAEYWPRHYQLAMESGLADQTDLDQHVFEFLSRRESRIPWIKRYQTTTSRLAAVSPTGTDGFEVACGLGQEKVVSRMLSDKKRHRIDDIVLQSALGIAFKNHQSAVIPILLRAGARRELAPCFAAERNMVAVVDQLLEQETSLEITSTLRKAIVVASTHGCLEVVTRLCDYCTEPGELARVRGLALEGAVIGSHASIVSLLLLDPNKGTTNPHPVDLPTFRSSEEGIGSPETSPSQHKSALETAATLGRTDIITLLLEAGIEATDLALENASKQQSVDAVRLLTESLTSQGRILKDSKALHLASQRGYLNIVTELLKYGVSPNCRDSINQTPLHKASKQGHKDVVQLLLQMGADRNTYDDHRATPCHLAVQEGHIETYRALQEDHETQHDDLLLTYAAKGGHWLMVEYLLSSMPKIIQEGDQNILDSALLDAVFGGYLFVVRELCEAGANLNTRTGMDSPLHRAADGGYDDIASYLITKGAEISSRDEAGRTPLHLGIAYPKVVKLLLDKGANPNVIDLDGRSPLHCVMYAVGINGQEIEASVQMLLESGAEIDAQDNGNRTPLHWAAWYGLAGTVKVLLDNGADVKICDKRNRTPFGDAVYRNHVEVAQLLLENGSDINHPPGLNITPLYNASQGGMLDMVRLLISKGADIHHRTRAGLTPLHAACEQGSAEIIEVLLRHKANINVTTNSGITPLHVAATKGYLDVITVLLDHHADTTIKDRNGYTALDVARKCCPESDAVRYMETGITEDEMTSSC